MTTPALTIGSRRAPSSSAHRMVGRAYRRLPTADRLRRGDQVWRDHAWRPVGGLDGWMWDTQIYPDSPPYRRPANDKAEPPPAARQRGWRLAQADGSACS